MRSSPADETKTNNLSIPLRGNPVTDEELVAAAKNGDERAFEMLIKRHQSRIFATAFRYTRIYEDAEDIVQQTLQKVFIHLRKFQGKSSFSTWLTRVAINESLMFLRKLRTQHEVSIEDSCSEDLSLQGQEIFDSRPNPEMLCLEQETMDTLRSAMSRLRPALRVVMELKELRELTGSDTARQIGISVSAVKARVFHGRRKLRKILSGSARATRVSGSTMLAAAGSVNRPRKVA